MFPILNVVTVNSIGINKMSNLKSEIDTMTPEQVMSELPLEKNSLQWENVKRILLWLAFWTGIVYLVFGM